MGKRVLAFDFGASSGRAMLGSFDGERITMREIHRFENCPVKMGDTLYWDILALFKEVRTGLVKAAQAGGFDSVGIDTWGVDFGLIGSDGHLLEAPVHYRDSRTDDIEEDTFKYVSSDKFYSVTGNQIMNINTAFQLMALKLKREKLLKSADKLLLMPDLFDYLLTGEMHAECSIASTTQLMDAEKKQWSEDIIRGLGLERSLFPDIVPGGTRVGRIKEELCRELDIPSAEVIAVCGHDTQCAAAAVPAFDKDFIFISCGTWSLFGTESDTPVISEKSRRLNVTNECGFGGKTTFLKNIIGLWLIQETRRCWASRGEELSFSEMADLAGGAEPFRCFIDPNAPEFVPPGDIPGRVREYCRKTGQFVPETKGEILRCIYESLALAYRAAFDEIRECTGKEYGTIHMAGGGVKAEILCGMTASACGVPVAAGPVEATAYGNIAVQLSALGEIGSAEEMRRIIAGSEEIKHYEPSDGDSWEKAYEAYKKII